MMLKIKHLTRALSLELLNDIKCMNREIKSEMLSRPGVELAGFLDFFDAERLILIGSKEAHFLDKLPYDIRRTRVEDIFMKNPPGVIFSVNVDIEDFFFELGDRYEVAILRSQSRTTPLSGLLYQYLHSKLAPRTSMHGVLLDIHGLGTLITGKSGIGKSETALELIKRGHLLISDDRVDIFEAAPGVLIGSAPKVLEKYIEVRGIGIVDVVQMFGAGAYRENKKIRLVVELEHWKKGKQYDRLGIDTETIKIFNTEIAKITIPILPGRNVATLVESAAMNQKLKYLGYNAAFELTQAVSLRAAGKRKDDEDDEDY
ncbi:MAG TPA: HPr(Ser) kinase/phosphatase [Acholeplasmataceae bacterium]|nr:HPr(Ser) kinase/phosphatase [Acholeplasmataceae bacterium]HBO66753.1 HPr(Ser) kinase/phosphatase [Acholeplasmataceae bacterium]HBS00841.1 HPr(Ser) kinase/phosphatase [Acholeplasmataceae bacterium]HCZ25018.1 HPr(Ser) kinase/phosphatase [Acholeplasmataceae bacterium]